MKDKIKEIFDSELFVCMEKDICGLQRAADQLTALMCYHIVKAYYRAYADFHGELSWESFTAEVEGHYLEEFDGNGELLRQAIEQVKKENKYER